MDAIRVEEKLRRAKSLDETFKESGGKIDKWGVIRNGASLLELKDAATFDSFEEAVKHCENITVPGRWLIIHQTLEVDAIYDAKCVSARVLP